MIKRSTLAVLMFMCAAAPASDQVAVFDPANFIQTVLIAERTQRRYEELVAQYRTVQRMARGILLGPAYRVPVVPATSHDLSRWTYGRPWLQGMNSGDAAGEAYLATAVPLTRPTWPTGITQAARRLLER